MTSPGQSGSGAVLPPLVASALLVREIVLDLGRWLLAGRLRDRRQVARDYDQGSWRRAVSEKRWLACRSVEDYVVPPDETMRVAKISHRLVRISTAGYYRYRNVTLRRVLAEHGAEGGEMVELGCGAGLNLLTLATDSRWTRLNGFDISENGIAAAREAARHFGLAHLRFHLLDATDPAAPGYDAVRGKTVFTYYCLEQLKYAAPAVFENLIRHGARRVIHFETSVEQLNLLSLRGLANYVYIRRRDYQSHLLRPLEALARQGRARIVKAWRPGYAPSVKNDPLVVVWEPVAG
jgi:hypothetical protein